MAETRKGSAPNVRISPGASHVEFFEVDPATLAVAAMARLGELHALGALDERRRKRSIFGDVAQEQFPTFAIAVLERVERRHFLPFLVEHRALRPFGVEERAGRRD